MSGLRRLVYISVFLVAALATCSIALQSTGPSAAARVDAAAKLIEHCQAAVRHRLVFSRRVVVDSGLAPPAGHVAWHVYQGRRRVVYSDQAIDMRLYAPMPAAVSGAYVVDGAVDSTSGHDYYACSIYAMSPLFLVTSVDFRTVK